MVSSAPTILAKVFGSTTWSQTLSFFFFLTSVVLGRIWLFKRKHLLTLPPSPRGWPLLGHIFDLDIPEPWKVYHQWCTDLGSTIIHLNMAGHTLIILDSYEDCIELLEKRSASYSGRMRLPMVNELMGWNFSFALADYGSSKGNTWRDRRRLMLDSLNPNAVKSFRPLHLRFARDLLPKLMHTTDIMTEFRHLAGRNLIAIAYGLEVKAENDPFIHAAEVGAAVLHALIPGKFLVDSIPILKHVPEWVPGAGFKKKAREWRKATDFMLDVPFTAFLEAIEKGEAPPSFAYDAFQNPSPSGVYTLENIKAVAGTFHQAGSDTTIALLGSCILLLLDRPDIVEKIQAEIDLATGGLQLPDYENEDAVPHLTAAIKETMRYWSIAPLSVPHITSLEDQYKGYAIPCGATIIPNSWAILHNEKVFPDPFKFKPERFLQSENSEEITAHCNVAWGYGRRICPGRYLASAMTWITLAHIFAVYNINKAVDEHGNIIEPLSEINPSIVRSPPHFRCCFTPRFTEAGSLLASITDSSPGAF